MNQMFQFVPKLLSCSQWLIEDEYFVASPYAVWGLTIGDQRKMVRGRGWNQGIGEWRIPISWNPFRRHPVPLGVNLWMLAGPKGSALPNGSVFPRVVEVFSPNCHLAAKEAASLLINGTGEVTPNVFDEEMNKHFKVEWAD